MKLIALLMLLFSFNSVFTQELNCNVEVVHPGVSTNDERVFESLKQTIFEFMNNTKWTSDNYKVEERIGCSIFISVSEMPSSDRFVASIQVQSWRPGYKTNYNSTLLNFNDDDFTFQYVEFQQLQFALNQTTNNLTSALAYYAYVILGLDYDSYALNGGQNHFETAQTIVNTMQSTGDKGWKAFDGTRNRYWLVENALNPALANLRSFWYEYHLKGIDVLESDETKARMAITAAILTLKSLHENRPNAFLTQLLLNGKSNEIVNIYKEAFPNEKTQVVTTLSLVDAPNIQTYSEINK